MLDRLYHIETLYDLKMSELNKIPYYRYKSSIIEKKKKPVICYLPVISGLQHCQCK